MPDEVERLLNVLVQLIGQRGEGSSPLFTLFEIGLLLVLLRTIDRGLSPGASIVSIKVSFNLNV